MAMLYVVPQINFNMISIVIYVPAMSAGFLRTSLATNNMLKDQEGFM